MDRCHAVSSHDCNLMTTAGLTLEKGRCPNIVTESKFGANSIQVGRIKMVCRPIDHCARKNVSLEATEKPLGRVRSRKRNYFGWGLIKVVLDFTKDYKSCSNNMPTSLRCMCPLGFLRNKRHDSGSYLEVGVRVRTQCEIRPSKVQIFVSFVGSDKHH